MSNKFPSLDTFAACFYDIFLCFSSGASKLLFGKEDSLCRFFLRLLKKHQKNITVAFFGKKKYQGEYLFSLEKLHVFTVRTAILILKFFSYSASS
jgi:hypothetical protein